MSIVTPTARPRYGPPPHVGVHPEAGGFVATCRCSWLRWTADEKHAATDHAAHVAKCKRVAS